MYVFSTLECMARTETKNFLGQWQQLCGMVFALHGLKGCKGRGHRRLWAYDRGLFKPGFFDQNLLGSFNSNEFKGRMRMDVSIFDCLCIFLHRTCKDAIQTCAWPFLFK